jgi:hypothetical protein
LAELHQKDLEVDCNHRAIELLEDKVGQLEKNWAAQREAMEQLEDRSPSKNQGMR